MASEHDDHPVATHADDTAAHAHAAQHHAERGDRHPAIILCLDESPASDAALAFALSCWRGGADAPCSDDLYLLSVLPPLSSTIAAAPVAPTMGMAAAAHTWEEQRSIDEKAAAALLRAAARTAIKHGVPRANIHAHVLPAAGGASGVAASIAEFVRARHGGGDKSGGTGVALCVLGSRGLGAARAALMGALGLGSVSDYALRHCPAPVAIVRGSSASPAATTQKRVVVVAVDESPGSSAALSYAAERGLLSNGASVRIVCSAVPVPFPALDETAAAAALEARSWQDANEQAQALAKEVAERHAATARTLLLRQLRSRVDEDGGNIIATATAEDEAALDVTAVALKGGGGGPADAGAALCSYAAAENASLVVVGSRGMGALRAAVAGLVGLGSVSLYASHHAPCPVVVVRGETVGQGGGGGGAGGKAGHQD